MKLTRDDWLDAAYRALLAGGPKAVAVAPLSKTLGATRGSFYHYFTDRQALLAAALERWEHAAVDAFIQAARSEDAMVAATGDRVIARRHDFLVECYGMLGYSAADAEDRALVAYTMFTGWLYLNQEGQASAETANRVATLARNLLLEGKPAG